MLLPGPHLHFASPWQFGGFCDIFLPNIGKVQKKVLPSEHEVLGTLPYGKSGLGYCIMFTKAKGGLKVATFRTKTFNFIRVVHLNWLVKIELRERGPPGRQYCYYLLLYAKNAQRN